MPSMSPVSTVNPPGMLMIAVPSMGEGARRAGLRSILIDDDGSCDGLAPTACPIIRSLREAAEYPLADQNGSSVPQASAKRFRLLRGRGARKIGRASIF
jgi:hypothetical protein